MTQQIFTGLDMYSSRYRSCTTSHNGSYMIYQVYNLYFLHDLYYLYDLHDLHYIYYVDYIDDICDAYISFFIIYSGV